ncbi:6c24b831-bb1d-44d5-a4e5-7e3e44c9496a [Sclerotinia trifoliorum]|uniref:6c24b831-bb1d-44d5-a4e5-7e3e44c9496a n=1 Tax=Sclerotinia trifoliorum TaxID=28548 RepID=A0A8H2ZS06_9HELO|nr:6c24b831-bb1d-44d5-a4e5-7e3e44c9496a [Sclerotinia trifoliorum]
MPTLFGNFNLPTDFLGRFLKSQFKKLPYPETSSAGQTVIITGANTGLGLEAARHIVRLNAARVILACRSLSKGEAAINSIKASLPDHKTIIEVWQVDLTSYASVKEFCAKVNQLDRLDVLLENAGLAVPKYEEFEDMESTVTVNVMSTFLMALLVLPKLRESAAKFDIVPRLTIVASDAHEQALFKEQTSPSILSALKNPQLQPDRYNVSKLLEILMIRELAPRLSKSDKDQIILNTLTPGFCHSELMRHAVFPLNIFAWIGKSLLARTAEVGSRTLVAAAAAGVESHGMYMVDCEVSEPSRYVRSEEGKNAQVRVYTEVMEALEGIEPGITNNI